ncbi:hypothetical protein WJX77_010780 [Trebouxia sp. C0004]
MLATLPEQAEVLFDLVSQSTVRNKQSPEESAEHYGLDNGGAATAVALLDAPGADGQILTHIRFQEGQIKKYHEAERHTPMQQCLERSGSQYHHGSKVVWK